MKKKNKRYKILSRIFLVLSLITILITVVIGFEIYESNKPVYGPDGIPYPHASAIGTFELASGTASILGLFFTFFFHYKDKKERLEEKSKYDKVSQTSSGAARVASRIVEDLSRQDIVQTPHYVKFEIDTKYDGYRTQLTYKNIGDTCARNVRVNVIQNEKEKLSETVIVNCKQFPIAFLMPGDWFYVDVDCYYPKTIREFHVQWEDGTGEHDEPNMVLLSKDYIV